MYFICKLFLSQLVMDIPGALLRAVFGIIVIYMELFVDLTFFDTIRTKTVTFALISFSSDFLGKAPKEKQFSFISHFTSLTKMTKLI